METLLPVGQKQNIWSTKNLSEEMTHLFHLINDIYHQSYVSLDDVFNTVNTNSNLGKLYQLFVSSKNNEDNLFDDLILKTTQVSIPKLNQKNNDSINFIEFMKQIDFVAKENHLSKEYVYEELLHRKIPMDTQNQNNNALHCTLTSHNILLNEYNKDFSQLKNYFIEHSEKPKDKSDHRMNCFTFIECFSQHVAFNKFDIRLQLNGLFCQVQSSLANQSATGSGSLTIDFHGFMLCLQRVTRMFNINLRMLMKKLINPYKKKENYSTH
ncbi:unnamed protein product [Rotaria magnacalcarata]|uniref:Uncharacterized protein n=3 Tax=Rotaria magnacalcarata TaxID=392030 RepID=A0A816NUB9_9BILA|nr:unnamed protein product [Rotaria magnacalcarata]CAF3961740.1 unnamed protein product [Rotaria magnacalcarata]